MIKRILKFDKDDWDHVWWLFKNMCRSIWNYDFGEAYESWLWIKIHFQYDHTKKIKG